MGSAAACSMDNWLEIPMTVSCLLTSEPSATISPHPSTGLMLDLGLSESVALHRTSEWLSLSWTEKQGSFLDGWCSELHANCSILLRKAPCFSRLPIDSTKRSLSISCFFFTSLLFLRSRIIDQQLPVVGVWFEHVLVLQDRQSFLDDFEHGFVLAGGSAALLGNVQHGRDSVRR